MTNNVELFKRLRAMHALVLKYQALLKKAMKELEDIQDKIKKFNGVKQDFETFNNNTQ